MNRPIFLLSFLLQWIVPLFLSLCCLNHVRRVDPSVIVVNNESILKDNYWFNQNQNPIGSSEKTTYTIELGQFTTSNQEKIQFKKYIPVRSRWKGTIFVSHGFLRSIKNMEGWGEIFAYHGYTTILLEFIQSTVIQGNHDKNAFDLLELSNSISSKSQHIFLGFSAGGLSSLIASSKDDFAIAYIGLDPVDNRNLAKDYIRNLKMPSLFLWGEPSSCNAENNLKHSLYFNKDHSLFVQKDINYASHCHFEKPYDSFCGKLCGSIAPEKSSDLIQKEIQNYILLFIQKIIKSKNSIDSIYFP